MTTNLELPNYADLERFLILYSRAKEIEAEMKAISDRLKATVKGRPSFDALETYILGNAVSFSTNAQTAIDVPKALVALESKEKRRLLLPAGIDLKPGKSKELAEAEGLLIVTRSALILKVLKG